MFFVLLSTEVKHAVTLVSIFKVDTLTILEEDKLDIACVAGGFKGLGFIAREIMASAMRKTPKI